MESKYEDRSHQFEHKYQDDVEQKMDELVIEEEKPKDSWSDRDEHKDEETALVVVNASIFGKDMIVQRLVDFWSTKLTDDITAFFDKHLDGFKGIELDGVEHKHEYTRIHKRYEDLVERHLDGFRQKEGISPAELYKRLRTSSEENDLARMIIGLVLSCADYTSFIEIMRSRLEARNARNLETRVEIEQKA